MRRVLVGLVGCLLVGGCSWTESDDEGSAARPVAQRIVFTKFLPGRHEVWIARLDGSGKRRLAEGSAPAISPDGRWVAFQGGRVGSFGWGFHRDVMLVAASGGRPRLLVRAAHGPVWSPDSKRVALLQDLDDGRRALLSIQIERGEQTTVHEGRSTTSASRHAATRSPTRAAKCSGRWTSTSPMPTEAASGA